MPFSSKDIVGTLLFIMVISTAAVCVSGSPKEKTFNLKIGFDLSQGENGAPSLRIRNFEDSSELNRRAKEGNSDEISETIPEVRADSSSAGNSDDGEAKNIAPEKSSKERESSGKSSEDNSDYSGNEDRLVTRGLKAADFEPEASRHKRNALSRREGKWESKRSAP